MYNIFYCLINISQTHEIIMTPWENTKEKHLKHFLIVSILHKKNTDGSVKVNESIN